MTLEGTMNRSPILFLLSLTPMFVVVPPAQSQQAPPPWAYPVNPPNFKPSPDDGALRRVPNSTVTLTLTQVRDRFYAPNWHPGDQPPMPEVVARGRKPDVAACGFCHRANGFGGPENANIAGLPKAYIIQQMAEFKSGARQSSVQKRAPTLIKDTLAKAITDAEVEAAAAYFASIKPGAVISVVETDMVPKTHVTGWFLSAVGSGEMEPIGDRIIEVPENLEQFVSRDARARFIAYVPIGSIQKGRELSATGDLAVRCGTCHGPDLKGLADIPGIAGRSPTYSFRQLYDLKHGTRAGPQSVQMRTSVENLSTTDMIALAAYAGSLAP
jgi:cytochrome c553